MTSRLLPPDEWFKLADRPPFDHAGLPDSDHWLIVVVEEDGQILASCALLDTVHWDGFHVNEDQRGNPAVFKQLLERSIATLQAHGVPGAHVTVPEDHPALSAMVERFGFIPAPGRLYLYAVPQKAES